MKLTEHFSLEEFSKSPTAKAHGIDNSVPESYIPRLKVLCVNVLEPLREHIGIPVIIGSGYRCPKLNALVGGVPKSQHQYGEAVDIHIYSISEGREWFRWIMENCQFDQLIWEHNNYGTYWIHVSYSSRKKNRQIVVRHLLQA